MIEHEVIIIGGGPAGSACAGELVKNGLSTLILDRAEFPRTKLCAGWVTPRVFRSLGIKPQDYPRSIIKLKKLIFHFYGHRFPLPTRQFSIRRFEFDEWLLKRSGADFRVHRVRQIRRDQSYFIIDNQFQCRNLIGAGGTHCPVYQNFFKTENPHADENSIITLELEYEYPWVDPNCYLWFFENQLPGYSWYVPKGNGYLNIGVGASEKKLQTTGKTIREQWQSFSTKLQQKGLINGPVPKPKGHRYYLRGDVSGIRHKNIYLVGDALGMATPDMGEGIGPAIESGILAARSIISGEPYQPQKIRRYSLPGLLFPGL